MVEVLFQTFSSLIGHMIEISNVLHDLGVFSFFLMLPGKIGKIFQICQTF